MVKKVLLGLVVVLVIMQLVPANLPEVSAENPDDLIANNEIPGEIATMIKTTCYDCHSNETVYPWYSYVAPVKFLVAKDTREGREHLNFSVWESLSRKDKAKALDEFGEEVEEGEMPMKIYPITHPDAKLSDADRQTLIKWAEDFADKLYE